MKLPHDTRYGTESFLNYSTLSSIISYDTYGTRIVNPLGIVTKKEQTDAMAIGSMVDEHLTE